MKATELRIGNWINYIGSGDVQLSSKEALCNVFDDLESEYPLSSPIPLTEEWLLKFGFKERDDERYRDIRICNKLYLAIEIKKLEAIIGDAIEWTKPIKIKYVHQLQNLYFALTGEELTIK